MEIVEVRPLDMIGRIEPFVRRAILDGTAIPSPAMASQGDMRELLALRDIEEAQRRGFTALTTDELQRDLAAAMVDREGDAYRRYDDWAEAVEDRIDDLEVELERRAALSRLGA